MQYGSIEELDLPRDDSYRRDRQLRSLRPSGSFWLELFHLNSNLHYSEVFFPENLPPATVFEDEAIF